MRAMPVIRVVDDDASFRRALGRLLRASGYSVECYASAGEFLARPGPDAPGCVLLDLRMPGVGGLELQEALAKEERALPVVFLTGHGDIPTSVRAMRRGAEDFLTKTATKGEILDAVRRALDRDARTRAAESREEAVRRALGSLSPRQLDVLRLVVRGRLNKQIAAELGIHERTVKLHRTSITSRLGMRSTAELTRLWIEAGETDVVPWRAGSAAPSAPKGSGALHEAAPDSPRRGPHTD